MSDAMRLLQSLFLVELFCFVPAFGHPDSTFAQVESAARDSEPDSSGFQAILQSAAENLEVSAGEQTDTALVVSTSPLMTYSDPARGYPAAGVWRIGQSGRPRGLVAIEYWPDTIKGGGFLSYELLSFRDGPLQLTSGARIDVQLSRNAISMQNVPDSAIPRGTKPLRLIQMKQLAARFNVEETLSGEFYALRQLPRPIDRYDDAGNDVVDGAAFAFVYGTNPEVLLLIECDEEAWRFGTARMSSAEIRITLGEREVTRYPELTLPFPTQDYQSTSHRITRTPETN